MEKSLELVRQLVNDFREHEKAYLAPSYQESQVRQDFIDKFLTALGWDVSHQRQKNPYEQEVKIENKVSTQGSQRRADYAFFIAPNFREVKFYAEAKKPEKNLKNAAFYHQTIRYGWNSATPIAILTDFEEFHILDCRYKPDIDNALNRKLEYFHYSEYADEEKFKKIFYLFGREAVANGSLEKYVAVLPKPRGKAKQRGLFPARRGFGGKGAYQPVDEAFLEDLDTYRETLAKAFKKENPDLGSEELTEAVQRTIDRLVFIRFLEDKQIEDPQMMNYIGSGSAWKKFSAHCRSLEPKYNGLVFKKHRILDDTGFVPPDDNTFADICDELADPSSPYDFDKIPISILGSIYERFLGKVVHATAKQVRVEPKPEVRKAGGVYYTPQYIVRYIVSETVGKMLYKEETVIARSDTDGVGRTTMQSDTSEDNQIASVTSFPRKDTTRKFRLTPTEVAKLRIADIACGSGSFLIEVYSELLEYHERYYAAHPEAAKKGDLSTRDGKQVLSLKKRQEILVNNIYGVDIDFQATEVTQLSLYLKLLEEATLNDAVQFSLLKEKLLPDLKNNIVCGNSLIGTDINTGQLFENKDTHNLKPMNFEDVFPEIIKRGGFDAVVGNPPYVNLVSIPDEQRKYFQGHFRTCKNKSDLYSFFLENALKISKNLKSRRIGYIIPHTWLATDSFSSLRSVLFEDKSIEEIVELGFAVFRGVIVSTVILICSTGNKLIRIRNSDFSLRREVETKTWEREEYRIDLNWNPILGALYEKIEHGKNILRDILQFSRGIKTSDDDKFLSREATSSLHKPIYRGRNIKAYQLNWNGEYIWYRPDLMKKKVGSLPHSKEFFEVPEKLVTQRVNSSMQLLVAYDNRQNYFLDTTNVSRYESWDHKHAFKFLCAVLNSKLINFWYCNKFKMPTIGLYELESIPIRTIDFTNETEKAKHDHIVNLVEQMLKAKEELAAAKLDSDVQRLEFRCATLDRQIDEAVYELYGLTEEEIGIVEGKT